MKNILKTILILAVLAGPAFGLSQKSKSSGMKIAENKTIGTLPRERCVFFTSDFPLPIGDTVFITETGFTNGKNSTYIWIQTISDGCYLSFGIFDPSLGNWKLITKIIRLNPHEVKATSSFTCDSFVNQNLAPIEETRIICALENSDLPLLKTVGLTTELDGIVQTGWEIIFVNKKKAETN